MNFFVVLSSIVMVAYAQRPSYASSGPIGRPGLANRFKSNTTSSSTNTTVSFENRLGENGSTPKIPVDARGDLDLVNTLNSWDRDHQPFWFINADHIEKARNTTRVPGSSGQNQGGQNSQLENRNQLDTQGNSGSFSGSGNDFQNNRNQVQSTDQNESIGTHYVATYNNGGLPSRAPTGSNNADLFFGGSSQGGSQPTQRIPFAEPTSKHHRHFEAVPTRPHWYYPRI
ncbi:hypothetical protein HHI36_022841 [Cryptolaemus montrouzieri]|uniref:Uncharacterized protein n=1 Tax=Cryptolaemus montrouzieri TaxID=559131 RepID=A0ABD2PFJ8_9CUCU